MTQVKSKKTKYASKVEEQIVDAIKSGKCNDPQKSDQSKRDILDKKMYKK